MATLLPWLVMSNYSLDMKIFLPRLLMSNLKLFLPWLLMSARKIEFSAYSSSASGSCQYWACNSYWWPLKHWLVAVECCLSLLVVWLFFVSKWQYGACNSNWWSLTETLKLNCLWFESLLLLSVVEPAIMFVPELEAAGSTPHKHHNWAIW